MRFGIPELILILVVVLLFVGPKKLPDAGAALGKAVREFRAAFSGKTEEPEKKTEPEASSEKKN